MYENICLENIKKLLKYVGKCEYQQQYKDVLEADTVSTHTGLMENSTMVINTFIPVKKIITRKPF